MVLYIWGNDDWNIRKEDKRGLGEATSDSLLSESERWGKCVALRWLISHSCEVMSANLCSSGNSLQPSPLPPLSAASQQSILVWIKLFKTQPDDEDLPEKQAACFMSNWKSYLLFQGEAEMISPAPVFLYFL